MNSNGTEVASICRYIYKVYVKKISALYLEWFLRKMYLYVKKLHFRKTSVNVKILTF